MHHDDGLYIVYSLKAEVHYCSWLPMCHLFLQRFPKLYTVHVLATIVWLLNNCFHSTGSFFIYIYIYIYIEYRYTDNM